MFHDFSNMSDEELDKKLQDTYERINKMARATNSVDRLAPLTMFRDEIMLEKSERGLRASLETPESGDNKYNDGVVLDTESDFERKKEEAEADNNKMSRREQWKEFQDKKLQALNDKEEAEEEAERLANEDKED